MSSIVFYMLYCDPQMSTSWCCQKKNHGIIKVIRSDPLGVTVRSTLHWIVVIIDKLKSTLKKEMHQQIILQYSPCTKGLSTADISKHRTIEDKIIQCPTSTLITVTSYLVPIELTERCSGKKHNGSVLGWACSPRSDRNNRSHLAKAT